VGDQVARFYIGVSMTLEQLVIVGLLFVLFCVWTVALSRVWLDRRR